MTPTCAIDGCHRAISARGWCAMHYMRWHRHGDPLALKVNRPHVVKHGTVNEYSNYGCRCDECREVWRVKHLEYMHADPERLRRHALRERAKNRSRGQRPYEPGRGRPPKYLDEETAA